MRGRRCWWLLAGIVVAGPAAAAGEHGVVVRLDATQSPTSESIVVHLDVAGADLEVPMVDDGNVPDTLAGDGVYSGSVRISEDSVGVRVSAGAASYSAAAVTWEANSTMRDLSLTLVGDALTARAGGSVGVPGAAPDGPSGGPPNADGGTSGGAGPAGATGSAPPNDPAGSVGSGTSNPMPPPASLAAPMANPRASQGSSGALYIGVGLGILALAALVYSMMRQDQLPPGVTLLPERGLLGPGTPSVRAGLAVWEVPPGDVAAFGDLLIGTLARHHRVIVVAADWKPAPVTGGPVYRLERASKGKMRKAIHALAGDGGAPLAVVIAGPQPVRELAASVGELPDDVGGIILASEVGDVALPVVRCRRVAAGWEVEGPEGKVRAAEVEGALRVESA